MKYSFFSIPFLSIGMMFISTPSFAAQTSLSASTSNVVTNIGVITSVEGGVNWVLNLFAYFGWAGVIIGVGLAIFSLIYKLINSDSDQAMKTVQGYLTKAVLIVVAGILLIGASFIVTTIRALFGQASPHSFGGVSSAL